MSKLGCRRSFPETDLRPGSSPVERKTHSPERPGRRHDDPGSFGTLPAIDRVGLAAALLYTSATMPKRYHHPKTLFPSLLHGFSQVVAAEGGRRFTSPARPPGMRRSGSPGGMDLGFRIGFAGFSDRNRGDCRSRIIVRTGRRVAGQAAAPGMSREHS